MRPLLVSVFFTVEYLYYFFSLEWRECENIQRQDERFTRICRVIGDLRILKVTVNFFESESEEVLKEREQDSVSAQSDCKDYDEEQINKNINKILEIEENTLYSQIGITKNR